MKKKEKLKTQITSLDLKALKAELNNDVFNPITPSNQLSGGHWQESEGYHATTFNWMLALEDDWRRNMDYVYDRAYPIGLPAKYQR